MKIFKRILLVLVLIIIATGVYYWIKFSANNIETKTMNDEARKNVPGQFTRCGTFATFGKTWVGESKDHFISKRIDALRTDVSVCMGSGHENAALKMKGNGRSDALIFF